ncbi:GTPase-activating protein gyp3 [Fulvia fulva]|uniref:GTPase-activating protein gyp3 n=1 Tax=Passalora fulva TaxID=5499 RepID=A0A9Q8PCS1_PASFU|nr:GTPase-activating protein gyp3 [Fulvia fulva]KAK4620077.1 GTPase-activating protein gyp3 [Fulvia fulva]KAK4621184.1 GTPase-activating protein gyp3 [Fulvia fulva]UJO20045.1 GTPase-activating protein gyp3 [Fulvia fulva]WPV16918.1 GTPase-activating protein gyp3 [Fulvia fulva]WPV32478.1 GTPase-activating protein gyp3 [Fulvia fulva]
MHIAEQQRGWRREDRLSVAEAIKEAMDTSTVTRSKSASRSTRRPSVETPRDLPAPEPHLPLRKASAHGRLQSRKGSAPQPLFAPTQHQHQRRVRGFHPVPVQPPVPSVLDVQASSEHAFAGREPRRQHPKAAGVLENQTVLQHAHLRDTTYYEREANRPPPSPLQQRPSSERVPQTSPNEKSTTLKGSRSVGNGLRSLKSRISSKHGDPNGRLTPDSFTGKPRIPMSDEVRDSFKSALTNHSSVGPSSSVNTTRTSVSSLPDSFVKVTREDYDEGNDYSDVEDIMGMYETGFSSVPGSAKNSLDIRSIRAVDPSGRLTPEVHSIRSLQLERPVSQPQVLPPSQLSQVTSQPTSPTTSPTKRRPNAAHRRSQSASVLILNVPRTTKPGTSPSPSLTAPTQDSPEGRTSTQIVSNEHVAPPTPGLAPASDAVPRDRYGFKKVTHHVTLEQYDAWDRTYTKHIERRSKKWHALLDSFGLATSPAQRFPAKGDKIKRYVRKGIPPEFRGAAWFWYAGGPGKLAKEPGLYAELLVRVEEGELSDNDREHIERDLNRTFPDNIRFKPDPSSLHDAQAGAGGGDDKKTKRQTKELETPILKALRRLLQAFAVHNPQIGYCQSLNFIAGLLLLFLDEDEEKAFVLLNIVTSLHLPGTHGIALEGANIDIAVLMSCVKDSLTGVWAKLDDQGGMGVGAALNPIGGALRLPTVSLATTAWFMSLFVGTLPIESVLRVWDCLFFEGSKTLFRIALAIFKFGEPQILKVTDPMEVFQVVQTIPRSMLDINGLMDLCFKRRGGFGGVSQGLVERRRAERRRMVKEGINAATDEGTLQKLRGRFKVRTSKTFIG